MRACIAAGLLATCFLARTGLWAGPLSPVTFQADFEDTLQAVGPHGPVAPLSVTGKVEYAPGKVGKALVVGGDAAQLTYPVEGLVRPTQGTVEMWVSAADWPQDEQAFHVFFETEGPGWLVLYKFWNGGLLTLTGMDKSHFTSAFWETGDVPREGWHHLAGTWSRERVAFYFDGKQIKETPFPSLPQELRGAFKLGDGGWGKPHTSHTLLDGVRVYRYALPADQIALLAAGQPLTYTQGLPVQVEPHPSRQQWKVTVDGSGYFAPEGPGRAARVSVLSGGKEAASADAADPVDGVCSAAVDISRVPAGDCTVRVAVLDGAGKEVVSAEKPFTKPEAAPWEGNTVGMDDKVLPPFTELTVGGVRAVEGRGPGGKTVECWGRRYWMDGVLPTQIESGGQPMLAAPISLTASTAQGAIPWQTTRAEITGWRSTRADCIATAAGEGLKLEARTRVEYDGLLWTDVTLTPAAELELSDLTLRVPLRAECAKTIHHLRPSWLEDTAGDLPPGGFEAKGFMPYVWLGDDDQGLAWFAETEQGWTAQSGKPVIQVQRTGDRVELLVHIINVPTKLTRPLKLGFGLQATPVKPRPANARGWRLGNLGTADNLKDPSRGNLQVVWCNGNLLAYGYPWPQDAERFRQLVKDLHAQGTRVIPYVNLNFLAVPAPEFAYYSPDWLDSARCFNSGDVAEMGGATLGACPSVAAWRDFIAWKLAKFVEEFEVDGIYVDCWNPNSCLVEDHGCGWRDAQGNLFGRFSILGSREIVRRVREILTDRRPDAHIIIHMSTSVCIPMLSFADSMLDGEQYQATTLDPRDDYLGIVPLDKWRVENTGRQWGVVPFFLPEFTGGNRAGTTPTERLMGLMLLHDCSPWPIWCNSQVIFDAWEAVDKFGIVDAEFMPYWKPNGVVADKPEAVVSVYRKPGTALLVVFNTAQTESVFSLKLDAARLGLAAGYGFRLATDGKELPVADGAVQVTVPARGYRAVVVK